MGGSFDPPHKGHMNIAKWALELLPINTLCWVVSKRNPLKKDSPSEFKNRLDKTRELVDQPNMAVTDIESKLDINYTIDLLSILKREYPDTNFVWIMGADGMLNFHKWKDWECIFEMVPIAIFARPGYNELSDTIAASKYEDSFLPPPQINLLTNHATPVWTFLDIPMKNISSTDIRNKRNKNC